MKHRKITYAALTKTGDRAVNEDYCGAHENRVFVLCDGLGGHGGGEIASRLVVEKIIEGYRQGQLQMEESILYAQQALLQKQEQENAQDSMKTTVTCLEIAGDEAKFAYVGDSRIYHFENHRVRQRSLDHSVPQLLALRGEIKEKEIRRHADRSRLLRVMGVPWDTPKYQKTEHIRLGERTSFLLCSDGFWELIEEKEMCKTLKKASTPNDWLKEMEQIVLANGRGTNMDNYSAIAVFIR